MDIVKLYFDEIKSCKGLSKEETRILALKAQGGDKQAAEILTRNHLLLVANVARNYMGKGIEFGDLLGEGNAGLMMAIEKWDDSKGSSFTTVAKWYIKQSIVRNCMHNNRVVHLPEHISELMRTNRTEYSYKEARIDKTTDEGKSVRETLPSKERDVFYEEDDIIRLQKIQKFFDCLKPKEKTVMIYHYGIADNDKLSIEEIAELMNLTTTRINQLIRSAMKKMQEYQKILQLKLY